MTEAEWLNCEVPSLMMKHLYQSRLGLRSWFSHPAHRTLRRKWRLFLAACCQRAYTLIGSSKSPAQRLIEFAEHFTECDPPQEARERVLRWFENSNASMQHRRLLRGLTSPLAHAAAELRNIAGDHAHITTVPITEKELAKRQALAAEDRAQCEVIRDIFGNPFRPVSIEPSWLTSTVLALATSIYDSRDFSPMPILADALQDAGCDNEDILTHCRQPGEHVRGCWVVDLILGKS
jgi:hypothetical protein